MANKKKKIKVLAAMSGGVDSSVAAKLLLDAGYEVTGIFLHFWKDPEVSEAVENKCCSLQALSDARAVCRQLGIPLHTFNFSETFKAEIVDNFIREYAAGRTPNPCVRCNRLVKIGRLLQYARGLGFDYVATGHYVRLEQLKGAYHLRAAKDRSKDQSYFLYTFNQDQLAHLLFPLGTYLKPQVRRLAAKAGLPVAEKSDSQEICFIPEKRHYEFLQRHIGQRPGPIKLFDGTVLGTHEGLHLYTIGQRRGLKIGGTGPYYAALADWKSDTLYVVEKFDDPHLYGRTLIVREVNWLSGKIPPLPYKAKAVIRYHHPAESCTVIPIETEPGAYLVDFAKPQRAITPGQSLVFYKGDEVIGGGVIS